MLDAAEFVQVIDQQGTGSCYFRHSYYTEAQQRYRNETLRSMQILRLGLLLLS